MGSDARRRVGGRERGAVAVEAALITPIVCLLLFGIIEFGFVFRDAIAIASSTRVGARIASANAGAGPGDCDVPCTPANAPKFGQMAADAIRNGGSAMPKDSIDEMWVYRANDLGYPGADGSRVMACGTNCVKYAWVDARDQFRFVSGSWLSTSVNACANNHPDSIGIYIKVTHRSLTNYFMSSLTLSDRAVMQFEPLSTVTCAPNQHL